MSSIWADTSIEDLLKRVAVLEARVTDLTAQNIALVSRLEEWRTLIEADSKSMRADISAMTPAPAPRQQQVNGRRG